MSMTRLALPVALAALVASGCQKKPEDAKTEPGEEVADSKAGAAGKPERKMPKREELPPPPDVAKPPADAQKTDKGVFYKVLTPGKPDGVKPGANDTVQVHYTGWTTDGKMFDSSVTRKRPSKFALNAVIPGWTDGMQTMATGQKNRFWIPEELAYKGKAGAPQGMLVFDVELLEVIKAPEAPSDVAAAPADAKKTKLGVFYKVLTPGTGSKKPREFDRVKVNYSGWTTDGKMFDSSVTRGRPAEFALNGVIEGWTDGMQTMVVGQKNRFWIPENLAYQGKPNRPAGMLVFDVELLEIVEMPEPPPVPKDVAAAPKDAKKTDKGVAYKVLKKGSGKDHPVASSKVKVHYTGWTTDGKMFDSSVARGQPVTFPLTNVIPGWTDGLQTMVVGEKTRFWIPEELSYKGKPGRPQGMLVFDVELLEIDGGPAGAASAKPADGGAKPADAKPAESKAVPTPPPGPSTNPTGSKPATP
jgi:FKBP-type peptidyl-prolyl cis-trans isomerase